MSLAKDFPVLRKPPIVEVVCGVHFEPLELDGLVLGVYWDRRKDEFPTRQLQPALTDSSAFILGATPLRAIFVGHDQVHVLQLQHDRFFVNWRALAGDYPRFSSRDGRDGLLAKSLEEFDRFSSFCKERFDRRPAVVRIELSKIDLLQQGKHWDSVTELRKLLPLVQGLCETEGDNPREFALRFVEQTGNIELIVAISSVAEAPGSPISAVRLEARAIVQTTHADLEVSFNDANAAVNGAFFRLVKDLSRFESEKEAGK